MAYRGEIYLANLNLQKRSNEAGKIRPVLILQNDYLNESDYPTTIIMPLTTDLIDDAEPLRYRIVKSEGLEQESDLLITHIRAIDNKRLIKKIAKLLPAQLKEIKILLDEVLE